MPKTDTFKTDLDIYKVNGDYDNAKIRKIDIEKINFIYDSAKVYMKEIKDDIKTTGTRATWLLGILIIIMLGLVGPAFNNSLNIQDGLFFSIEGWDFYFSIKLFLIVLFSIYLSAVLIHARLLTRLNYGYSTDDQPRKIFQKSVFKDDERLIKIRKIQELQGKIDINIKLANKLEHEFDELRFYFIYTPFLSFALTVILGIFI